MFRWFALLALLGTMSVSAHYRRRARREGGTIARTREGATFVVLRPLVALPLFGSVAAYLVHPPVMAWASLPVPTAVRWIGVGLGLASVPAALWVFRSLGSNVSETVLTKDRHQLVTRGPYRWIRHPLYTTGTTLFLAVGLMAANWFMLLLVALVVVLVRAVVIPREETELLAKFGRDYEGMRRRTGRLLPKLTWRK